jgi:hypothetical protein
MALTSDAANLLSGAHTWSTSNDCKLFNRVRASAPYRKEAWVPPASPFAQEQAELSHEALKQQDLDKLKTV